MAALDQTHASSLLDASLGTSTLPVTATPLKCRLLTTTGTGSSPGTPVTGGTYSAQTVAFSPASSGAASNSATVLFPGMPAVTVVGIELWDSSATPLRKWYGVLAAPKALNAGDTFQISAGSLTATLG